MSGFFLAAMVVSISFEIVYCLLILAKVISVTIFGNAVLFHILNIFFIYTSLAAKSLSDEVYKVYKALKDGSLKTARKNLSYIVSRETANLSEKDIIKASIETTAENTVDGVISPLFYAFLGSIFGLGAPLVYAFKAISTLDSMVGYKNLKYKDFGYFSAKMDDVANYIPARITGILIVLASIICKLDYKNSFKILIRDKRNSESPNAGYPEAAFAGALNVSLGGDSTYFGKIVNKPIIGNPVNQLKKEYILDSIKLMYATFLISVSIFSIIWFLLEGRVPFK
jgi:adenosylcobinamide-phosphate synthase